MILRNTLPSDLNHDQPGTTNIFMIPECRRWRSRSCSICKRSRSSSLDSRPGCPQGSNLVAPSRFHWVAQHRRARSLTFDPLININIFRVEESLRSTYMYPNKEIYRETINKFINFYKYTLVWWLYIINSENASGYIDEHLKFCL